ncbi:MAG: DEAD/DEAH box helicase [Candidatus Aenigmarchaeota archaeon]|nr:DEAD/DEAH box helicase [Candidatus Aenigmarchaeota archaeon]
MKFEDMNIEKNVLGSLNDIGFKEPTRIQYESIPIIKKGYDVIGQSETGSGKTAAFGVPLVEKVVKGGKIQALVLAPTRELVRQIASDLKKFSRSKKLHIQTVYGGVSIHPQIYALRKAEIVIGTPGRILDHMRRRTLNTSNLKIFVLDEADEMIDMGFIEDIKTIEKNIPKNRQTLLFSATMSDSLIKIRDSFTKNAKKIKTKTKVSDDVLKQYYRDVNQKTKFSLLVHLIKQEKPGLSITFCNTRKMVDAVSRNLKDNGINATALHGGLSQARREKVMENFHKGITKILVATDVAARGLDIKNVTHIFNYDIPNDIEVYPNRIGRTARAGKSGKAISLLSRDDHGSFTRIIKTFSYDIEKMKITNFKILPFKKYQPNRNRNFRNRRPFRKRFRGKSRRRW